MDGKFALIPFSEWGRAQAAANLSAKSYTDQIDNYMNKINYSLQNKKTSADVARSNYIKAYREYEKFKDYDLNRGIPQNIQVKQKKNKNDYVSLTSDSNPTLSGDSYRALPPTQTYNDLISSDDSFEDASDNSSVFPSPQFTSTPKKKNSYVHRNQDDGNPHSSGYNQRSISQFPNTPQQYTTSQFPITLQSPFTPKKPFTSQNTFTPQKLSTSQNPFTPQKPATSQKPSKSQKLSTSQLSPRKLRCKKLLGVRKPTTCYINDMLKTLKVSNRNTAKQILDTLLSKDAIRLNNLDELVLNNRIIRGSNLAHIVRDLVVQSKQKLPKLGSKEVARYLIEDLKLPLEIITNKRRRDLIKNDSKEEKSQNGSGYKRFKTPKYKQLYK